MSSVKKNRLLWKRISLLSGVLVLLYFVGYYLKTVFDKYGSEKFISSLILIASLIVGLAYILLFIARKLIENDNSSVSKKKKRRLEKHRNIVNYITPFVLIAMGYHFWEKGWVLAIIVISILLLDRLNELIRKNK